MATSQQRALRNDILNAQRNLNQIVTTHGQSSTEYQEALRKLLRLWCVLKMTRTPDEFFHEVTAKKVISG